jgi:hypothetical protein
MNFRGRTSGSQHEEFLSGYDTTCTVLQQTKQGLKVVCVKQKFVLRVFFFERFYYISMRCVFMYIVCSCN